MSNSTRSRVQINHCSRSSIDSSSSCACNASKQAPQDVPYMPSGSVLSALHSLGSLRRRTSLRESIRTIASTHSSLKGKGKHSRSSSYRSYNVYQQIMAPIILRDPEVTTKLLEAILDTPGGRRSVSRLARTCKAMCEPALNILWRDLDSLIPILGLFPSSLLKKTRRPGLGLAKNPAEGDWSKILEYGERVRRIAYNETINNVAVSIFPIFEQYRPRTFILPNLQQLVWKVDSPAGLERCSLFLNPELESLSLEIGARFPELNKFLADLSSRTKLKEFSYVSPAPLPDTFTDLLLPQKGLCKVVLMAPGALSPGVGRWLASLEELKVLQLDLSGRGVVAVEGFFDELSPRSGVSTPSSVMTTDSGVFSGEELDFSDHRKSALRLTGDLRSKGSFATIRQLQLTGEVSNIAVFLRHLRSALTQLDLVIEDPPDMADWQDLSVLVSERFGTTLQSLRISGSGSSRYSELVRSTARAEAPKRLPLGYFTSLPCLLRLDIDLPESTLFTKYDIWHVSTICPMVEELRLCPLARFPVATGPPSLTLEDLAPLMANCPRLHTLSVVVNAKQRTSEVLSSRETSSASLLRLHVGHSWVGDTLHVTILLSHLAPHLETLKWFHEKNRPGYVEANARGWERVAEALPHLQNVRLSERLFATQAIDRVESQVLQREFADKGINATVTTTECEIQVQPDVTETAIQFSPVLVDRVVDAEPRMCSISIGAIPETFDSAIQASPTTVDQSVEAVVSTLEDAVDATVSTSSKSVEALIEESTPIDKTPSVRSSSIRSGFSNIHLSDVVSMAWKVVVFFPLTIPSRIIHMALERARLRREAQKKEETAASPSTDIPLNTIQDIYEYDTHNEHNADPVEKPERLSKVLEIEEKRRIELLAANPEVPVLSWAQSLAKATNTNTSATRHLDQTASWKYIMSDNKKQERDFTPEVDILLPEAESLAKAGQLQPALDKLFVLEKQTRNAADLASTTRLVKAVLEHCYQATDFTLLNSSILLLSKKHGQLKAAVQAMVEQAMEWLEDVKKKQGIEKWLELVETLRTVTEGKIFLETPRARVTLLLAHYHEGLSIAATIPDESKKSLETASELLSDLQVETYSSMERREKTEFLLEQMRLLIAVARRKDTESSNGGESEWVKVRVGGRKVNEGFLKEKENEDLKLKYYDLMIQHALHQTAYLDVANYYYKVWETPSIKEDVNDKGKAALEHIIYYVILAPHNNEQSDMLHRMFNDPALLKLELHYNLVKCFTTHELMRWPGIQTLYGEFLRQTQVFSEEKRWEDLHTRVIEHNIRVVAEYYTRITLQRLTSLLDLTPKQTEETLARLVVSKTVWARIDRPSGVVNFRNQRSPEDVMNDWSSDMQKLLGLVEKAWMGMNAAQAAQARVKS